MANDLQDLYARIVAAERPCLCACHQPETGFSEQGHHPGGGFNGSLATCPWNCRGTVAVLPLLREPCLEWHGAEEFGRVFKCDDVGCPGWQAKPLSLETVLLALVEANGWNPLVNIGRTWRRDRWEAVVRGVQALGSTPMEAFLIAVAEPVGVEGY